MSTDSTLDLRPQYLRDIKEKLREPLRCLYPETNLDHLTGELNDLTNDQLKEITLSKKPSHITLREVLGEPDSQSLYSLALGRYPVLSNYPEKDFYQLDHQSLIRLASGTQTPQQVFGPPQNLLTRGQQALEKIGARLTRQSRNDCRPSGKTPTKRYYPPRKGIRAI